MVNHLVLFVAVLLSFVFPLLAQTTYYVSSSQGNDSNNGTSQSTPWKTLSKVSAANLNPGSKVLFRKGETWTAQQLIIKKSGTQGNEILFGSYGSGERPVLSGNGSVGQLVKLDPNVHHVILKDIWFKDVNISTAYSALVFLDQLTNNITIESCKFSQTKKSILQWNGMILGRDNYKLTIRNCEFTGGIAGINLVANYKDSHNDVHHILIDNNWFHRISTRSSESNTTAPSARSNGIWFQQWFANNPEVEGKPGNVLGKEGTYRDIAITNNNFDSLHHSGIYWYRDMHFSAGWNLNGVPQPERYGYNWNISNNDFNLCEGATIELAPLSNRWGRNHPETGRPIEWSIIGNNRIDSSGYNYITKKGGNVLSGSIETHGWKQVYIQDNFITHSTSYQGDGHAINFDFSPAFDGSRINCDSVVARRNIIAYNNRNGWQLSNPLNSFGTYTSAAIQLYWARKDNEVYDNIIYECNYGIVVVQSGKDNNRIFNNTIFKCDAGIKTASSGTWTTTNLYKNNIISYCRKYGWWNTPTVTVPAANKSNNLWFGNQANFNAITQGTNDMFSNPAFLDTLNKNFKTLSGGAGINKGTNVTLQLPTPQLRNLDHAGNVVPFNLIPDIGTYEFNGGSTNSALSIDSIFTSNLSSTSVTLKCEVNTGNQSTTIRFHWDTDSLFWANNQLANNSPLMNNGTANYNLANLTPNTTYYYRAQVSNASGSYTSFVKSFITPQPNQTTITDTFYMNSEADDIMYYNGSANSVTSRFGETSNIYRGIEQIYKNLSIPQNAQITSAVLEVKANVSNSGIVVGDIYSDLRDDPSSVMSYTQYNGNTNFSSVSYQYSAQAYTAGNFYQIDITNVVQNRVNHSNWTNGDNLGIIIKGNTNLSSAYREITRAENSLTDNKLIITYSTGVPKLANSNEEEILPEKYELYQNYPNPFNPSTNIKFNLPEAGDARLFVYNILGEQIATLANGFHDAGLHNINFNAVNFSSGTYLYRLETKNYVQVMKMILIK